MAKKLGMEIKFIEPKLEKQVTAFIEADLNEAGNDCKVSRVLTVVPGTSGKKVDGVALIEIQRNEGKGHHTLVYALGTRLQKALESASSK
jgi:hypothetical protein